MSILANMPYKMLSLIMTGIMAALSFSSDYVHAELKYRGIKIAPEHRCSPYDRENYPYSQSVELDIIENFEGLIYGPYSGTCFHSRYETDIEHIISLSEAHDSGLCAMGPDIQQQFASDPLNLTLASRQVNRHQKSAKDLSEWLPTMNACWYAERTLQVRRKYGLTIDFNEANAIEWVLSACESTAMVVECKVRTEPKPKTNSDNAILVQYDDDGNGRITCREAIRHDIAPVHKSHPAYAFMLDGDGDGTVCE